MTGLLRRATALMRTGAGIAIAMAVMNLSTFGFNFVAVRLLGVDQYGGVIAMMSLLLVVSVGALGLQATAARRIAAEPEHVGQIETEVLRVSMRVALALGALLLVLTPVINEVLKLDDLPMAALAGVAVVPLTLMGGYAGILQGERRWLPLSVLYVAAGVPRLALGAGFLLWQPTEFFAILAVTIGAVAPVAVGWYALRHDRAPVRRVEAHGGRAIFGEVLRNSQALFAFFALSNVDVIVARNTMSGYDSGLYAAGILLAKAMIFLPQFVVVLAFPTMTSAGERNRALLRSMGLVGALGLVGTAGVGMLSWLALVLVGGAKYGDVQDRLWLFAVLGTVLAMLQLLVYAILARQGQRSILLVWAALVLLVVGGLFTDSLTTLLAWVLTVDVVLLAVLVAVSFLRREVLDPEPAPVLSPEPSSSH